MRESESSKNNFPAKKLLINGSISEKEHEDSQAIDEENTSTYKIIAS